MESFLSHIPNLETLTAQAANVFSVEDLPLNQTDINVAFKELNKTYKKYIRSLWEVTSLQTYVQHKIVYRGLRINLTPNKHQGNTEFIQGWQRILTETSLKLIDYLLTWEKKSFETISNKLEKEIGEINTFKPLPDFNTLELKLQKQIEAFQIEIKERKHKKFVRDKQDFETGIIYPEKNSKTGPLKTNVY